MRKFACAAVLVAATTGAAFAGGKGQVYIEPEPTDPFTPAAASSSAGVNSGVLIGVAALLIIAGIASASGTD